MSAARLIDRGSMAASSGQQVSGASCIATSVLIRTERKSFSHFLCIPPPFIRFNRRLSKHAALYMLHVVVLSASAQLNLHMDMLQARSRTPHRRGKTVVACCCQLAVVRGQRAPSSAIDQRNG